MNSQPLIKTLVNMRGLLRTEK